MTAQTPYRRKLIEVDLPLDDINYESVREKSIRHGHPSTLHLWWARKSAGGCVALSFLPAWWTTRLIVLTSFLRRRPNVPSASGCTTSSGSLSSGRTPTKVRPQVGNSWRKRDAKLLARWRVHAAKLRLLIRRKCCAISTIRSVRFTIPLRAAAPYRSKRNDLGCERSPLISTRWPCSSTRH